MKLPKQAKKRNRIVQKSKTNKTKLNKLNQKLKRDRAQRKVKNEAGKETNNN